MRCTCAGAKPAHKARAQSPRTKPVRSPPRRAERGGARAQRSTLFTLPLREARDLLGLERPQDDAPPAEEDAAMGGEPASGLVAQLFKYLPRAPPPTRGEGRGVAD